MRQEASTTRCGEYGQPEVVVSFDSTRVLERDVQWVLERLEEKVAAGARWKAGDPFQLGWLPLRFEAREDGRLQLQAPSLLEDAPEIYVDEIDMAVLHLRLMRSAADSLGLTEQLLFPSADDTALLGPEALGSARLLLTRSSPREGDSGWSIRSVDRGSPAHGGPVKLFTLARRLPLVVPLLALPEGIALEVDAPGQSLRASLFGEDLALEEGSFLALKFPRSKLEGGA
jgi:hypothetical protein